MKRNLPRRRWIVARRRFISLPCFTVLAVLFPLVMSPLAMASAAAGRAAVQEAARLLPVSWRLTGERFELRFEGVEDGEYRVSRSLTPAKVVIDAAVPWDQKSFEVRFDDPAIPKVRFGSGPLGTRVVIELGYLLPPPSVVSGRGTVVVSLQRVFHTVDVTYVAPGVEFGQVRGGGAQGPFRATFLRVDLHRPGVRVYPALAGERFGLEPVSRAAARLGALGAVNGGFFDWTGRPLGLLILDGQLVSEDIYGRTAFGIREDGTPFISRLSVSLWLEGPEGEKLPLDGINRLRASFREAVAYTSHYGSLPAARGARLYLWDGVVLSEQEWREVPEGGLVIEFDPADRRFSEVLPGQRWRLEYALSPDPGGPVRAALGAGPALLIDGEVRITGVEERFQRDVLASRAPRTALGLTGDGKLLLVVVDGRAEGFSSGMTLEELAAFMKELGAVSAMNLDGGGSATLVVSGRVLSRPSGSAERAVASLLLVEAGR